MYIFCWFLLLCLVLSKELSNKKSHFFRDLFACLIRGFTLEYQINVQQILFNFWVLAHLHAYFVLHNSTEKNVVQNLFFTTYLLPTRLFGLHVYSVP